MMVRDRGGIAFLALTQPPHQPLHADHRIIDDDAKSDHQAGQNHRVDRRAAQVQRDHGGQQRQRDRHRTDHGAAPVRQQRTDDQGHKNGRNDDHPGQVGDRILDVGRQAEHLGVDLDAGQAATELGERLFDAARDFQRVGRREFLDHQHQAAAIAVAAIDDGVTDHRRVCERHLGNFAQRHRLAGQQQVGRRNGDLRHVFRRLDRHCMLHAQPLIVVIDPAAGAGRRSLEKGQRRHPQCIAGGGDDVGLHHARVLQPVGVDLHMQLPQALAPDRHVGHAGHAQQAGLDGPARQQRQLGRLDLVRRNADHHEAAGGRQRLQNHRRRGHVRQRIRQGQAFLDHLAGFHDVGAALESEHDRRQPGHRLGADRFQPRHAAQQLFQIERDQAGHLICGQADCFGLNHHYRRRELGKDVDRHLLQLDGPEYGQRGSHAQHQEPEFQACTNNPSKHDCNLLLCFSSTAAHCPRNRTKPLHIAIIFTKNKGYIYFYGISRIYSLGIQNIPMAVLISAPALSFSYQFRVLRR